MLADVLERNPDWRNPPHLRAILIGGAPFPDRLRAEAARRGIPVMTTYGMTETGAPPRSRPTKPASRLSLSAKCRSRAPRSGPSTASSASRDRCSLPATGDAPHPFMTAGSRRATRDSSIMTVRSASFGRTSDMIITGGEKVVPSEVESPFESLPGFARRSSSACPMKAGADRHGSSRLRHRSPSAV